MTEAGSEPRRAGADAGADRGAGRGLRRRAPCRASVLQAQARPRQSGGARRGARGRIRANERRGFPQALVAAQARGRQGRGATRGAGARRRGGSADAPAAGKPEAQFDPASLPPIESINALSDITAFLREGVPAELTRAALRRVWTADPAIRDFVGLAENAWDFTDPNAMPGFGPLEDDRRGPPDDRAGGRRDRPVRATAMRQIPTGRASEDAENSNHSNAIVEEPSVESAPPSERPKKSRSKILPKTLGNQVLLQSNTEDIASQHDVTEAQEKPKQLSHRTHGGALPQ